MPLSPSAWRQQKTKIKAALPFENVYPLAVDKCLHPEGILKIHFFMYLGIVDSAARFERRQ